MWWLKSLGVSAVIACGFTPLIVAMSATGSSEPKRGQPYAVVATANCHEEPDAEAPVIVTYHAGDTVREGDHLNGWSEVGGCYVEASGIVKL